MEFLVIIIPHVKGKSLIRSVLFSLKKYPPKVDHKIVVIDNECHDGSIQYAKEKFPWIKIIKITKNVGFGAALNAGFRAYKAKYYLIMSDDLIIFEKNWFQKLFELSQKSEKIGIISPYYIDVGKAKYYLDQKIKAKALFKLIYPSYLTAASLLINRKVLEKIGLFEELFFPAYAEDVDFTQRAMAADFILVKDPNIVFLHYHGKTIETMYDRYYHFYSFYKSKLIYSLLRTKLRYFPLTILSHLKYLLYILIGGLWKEKGRNIPGFGYGTLMTILRILSIFRIIIQKRKNRKIYYDYKMYRKEARLPFIKYLVWRNKKIKNKIK